MSPDAVVTSGALIFYAGVVLAMLRNHDRRIDKNEAATEKLQSDVAYLRGKEGIQI